MEQLFGAPTGILAAAAAAALAAVLAVLTGIAWRRPVLVRLGLRALPRRRLRTALIVLGLSTSTTVIATAIGTGETMAGTVRAAVAGGIGPVDEVIFAGGRAPATPQLRDPRAVLAGGDLAAGDFFGESFYDRLAAALRDDPDVRALVPALQAPATAVNPAGGRARSGVNLLGMRPGAAAGGGDAARSDPFTTFAVAGGRRIALAELAPDEALVNEAAARLLALSAGDTLELLFPDRRAVRWRVRAVVRDGGIAGLGPAVLAELAAVQAAVDRPGRLNQILVANRRDDAATSRAVTGRLRFALADPVLLERAARGLAEEAGQGQMRALERRVRAEARQIIADLRQVSRAGRPTPELAYYLADPVLTGQYRWVINSLANDAGERGDVVGRLAPLTVLEVKQRAIAAANEYGSAVTTVFLILGLFSIAAGLLLVFLIFVMLAAERRTELGLMRAVGAGRHHLVVAFAVEGLAYDLAAAVLGLALGVGMGAVVLRLLQQVLDRFDVTVQGRMSGAGMLLAFCLGALVTFGTVLAAAWRVSRVNIVAAIHGAPEAGNRGQGLPPKGGAGGGHGAPGTGDRKRLIFRALGLLSLSGVALGLVVTADGPGPPLATGASLAVVTGALLARALAVTVLGGRPALVDRVLALVTGPVVALLFALSAAAPRTVHSDAVVRAGTAGFVLAGVVMALALVAAAAYNLDLVLWPVVQLARLARLAPAVRMAVAYPLTHPFRTALTAAMFALVFLTMVAATALVRSTEVAYVRRDGGAGFDVRAVFSTPPADFAGALARSEAVRPDDFTVIGGLARSAMEALWPDERAALWRPTDVRVADAALLGASSGELLARAVGFDSPEAVWRAVRDRPGAAVLARRDADAVPAVQRALARRSGGVASFTPVPVWLRDPRGGPARKLTVIGVTADGAVLPTGLLTSREALAGSPAADEPPVEFLVRTRPDISSRDAATGIQLSFSELGVRTRVLGEEARTGHAVRRLLDVLVRGFLGMGLASGLAALGVIGMRAVAERRQQIGMLRALGFSRRMVQLTFLIEGSVVAALGITVGGVVGLVLARNVVRFLARDFTQLTLIVPWGQVAAIAAAAYASALLSALLVAWQAGRVAPAEALRSE
jgi:putative ABC transport system permease protein